MEKIYKVPMIRVFNGCMYVKAESEEQAAQIASENIDSDFIREQMTWPSEWEVDTDCDIEEIDETDVEEWEVYVDE